MLIDARHIEDEIERRAAERVPHLTACRDAIAKALEAAGALYAHTAGKNDAWLLERLTDARDYVVARLADPVPEAERDDIHGDLTGAAADEWRGAAE